MTTLPFTPWQNENEKSSYPFSDTADVLRYPNLLGVFVDANFIQFSGYIPVLQSIEISAAEVVLDILCDSGAYVFTHTKADFISGKKYIRLMVGSDRYIGKLVFGTGFLDLFDNFLGRKLILNFPFSSATVVNIPKKDGLYSLNGLYGTVALTTTNDLFINVDGDNVTWNAAGILDNVPLDGIPLKQINLTPPDEVGNITLSGSKYIKVNGNIDGKVRVFAVTDSVNTKPSI